jgi:ABC-type sugar transport system permease subunit
MQKKKLVRYSKYGYLFSIPFVLAFLVFGLYPTLNTLILGFTDLKGAGTTEWRFLPTVGKPWYQNYVDGCNRIQTFFKVTLPCMREVLTYLIVMSIMGGLNLFDVPAMIIGTRCNNAGLTMLMYVQNQVFSGSYLYNRAAAASVILALLCSGLAVIVFYLRRDKDEAMLKKLRRIERREAKRLKQDT